MDRKTFYDSIVPIPVPTGPVSGGLVVAAATAEHRAETMLLHFTLGLPSAQVAELEAIVASGQIVDREKLHSLYAADDAAATKLQAWLVREGFSITHVTPDRTGIYATAKASQIGPDLQVTLESAR